MYVDIFFSILMTFVLQVVDNGIVLCIFLMTMGTFVAHALIQSHYVTNDKQEMY